MMTMFFRYAALLFGILFFLSPPVRAGNTGPVMMYAPPTPSSVPLILAAETLPDVQVKIFTNHSQAHSLFLKGDVQLLSTGLSVGVRFFRQGVPIKIINSYVSGLTWLVTDRPVKDFRDLKGTTLCLPFAGSPIEEVTQFFVAAEGLAWKRDIPIRYVMFPGAVSMLKQGRIHAAALPEPFVSLLQGRKDLHIALSYRALWEKHTGNPKGYPQVGTFVHRAWAKFHAPVIRQLNAALAQAIRDVAEAPEQAVRRAATYMNFSADILQTALGRTDFHLLQDDDLKREIKNYYQTTGAPSDETFEDFF
ncbi:hypothetical protein DENIS_2424 [Desulfonema ishimotonii]|uniref:ABC transporter substrate-binding protein n=1 Tax=Desulfonema ishimotonii TaxID=45657 RepID=A0A401FX08_9BACT|nr:ABC transporter substrate-binding protein [Desulfonema ishimotonii]GBC61464.1 hypothetical protein DENIS_2424 [Desulfonema ishimotonii]